MTESLMDFDKGRAADDPANAIGSRFETTGDVGTLTGNSLASRPTPEQLMREGGLSPTEWISTKVEIGEWTVPVRNEDNTVTDRKQTKYSITCKRVMPSSLASALDSLHDRFKAIGYRPPKRNRIRKNSSEQFMLEVSIVDHHFGNLAWAQETGESYDLNIAESLYDRAIETTLKRVSGIRLSKIVVPIGNDFFHFDTRAGTTEAGTPQDTDGRWAKVYDSGISAVMHGLMRLAEISNVHVVWVPGNHDYLSSWWLCKTLAGFFSRDKRVTFDITPRARKLVTFDKTAIGYVHGNNEKHNELPDLFFNEYPMDWAQASECREVHVGHLHQRKETRRVGTKEQSGAVTRILPSLCGTNAWHSQHGYSMCRHATQSFLYSNQWGLQSIIETSARQLLGGSS